MMSRTFQFGRWLWLLSTLTAAVWVAALPQGAEAAGFVYQQHTLNAGVLYPGSATDLASSVRSPAPYLFYVLNNRPDARPSDMNLINPQAPQTVSLILSRRWGNAAGYTVGANLTPNRAGYWEVPLHDASADQLHQFDVLYLAAGGYSFSPADNEKLRRFVDSGGQLIVEYNSAAGTPGLFTDTTFTPVVGALSLPMTGGHFLRHPLLSQPYLLTYKESLTLGTPTGTITPTNDGINIFGPVVLNGAGDGIAAGQFGAGQIIVSGLNIGGAIGGGNGATFASSTAPAQDLKFFSNLLSWSQTHPSEYKTSHGNVSANGLAAFSPAWLYPLTGTGGTVPPGATVWGNFVFVIDSAGTLHAFDAYPSENLIGDPTATSVDDAVAPADLDYSLGKPYDQIWSVSVGANASAPTVATHNGTTYLFVEKANGSLVAYNAVSGSLGPTLTAPTDATNYTAATYSGNAPSPTYYDGRLYAGQANGSLSVYDLNENSSVNVPLETSTTTPEAVSAPPSVGLLPNGNTNIITALVPTTRNLYTVLLGARDEPLVAFNQNGALAGYKIDRGVRYNLNNLTADVNAVPSLLAYDSGGNPNAAAPTTTSPQDPLFPITTYAAYFTDWDTDFAASTLNGGLTNLNSIAAGSYGDVATGSSISGTGFSAPAIDRRGDFYYTETNGADSYLVGVTNATHPANVLLKFRFRIPVATDAASSKDPTTGTNWNFTDADGVNYNSASASLLGYTFVGAPVVDDQGYVYAVAAQGGNATVLCFRGNQGASVDTAHTVSGTIPSPAIDLTQAVIQQQDEGSSSQINDLQAGQTVFNANGTVTTTGQFTLSTNSLSFYNFGKTINLTTQQVAGNLCEPQPINANAGPTASFSSTGLLLHTNLVWYQTPFATSGTVSGLSKVGPTLFLTDGLYLYKLPATPSIGAGKVVTALPSRTLLNTTGSSLGTVGAPPSIGGNIMVVNGTNGLLALTRQVTVIADNNRVLGVDGDGAATWSVDATTATGTTGVVTKVPFSHPVSLSQFADNQYLAADTGNNRCVRFDPGGNVQWELTRFSDPNGLMAPGQPLTLSQPTSVQVHTSPDTVNTGNTNGTANSYLIADSGNDRIVEVADYLDSNGNIYTPASGIPQSHVLTWVTHTGDQYGRHYRYGSATYYQPPSSTTLFYVAATVTNTRLGKLGANGAPGTASSDAPGGSIVLFNRPATPAAYGTGAAGDLIYSTPGFYNASGTAYTVKNPRFLQLNADLSSAATSPLIGTPFTFLYADDNGAFDLTYDTTKGAFVAETGSLQFTQASYDNMNQPVIGDANPTTYTRTGLPFVPTCVQRIDSDPTNPRYLITQTFSQAELGTLNGTVSKIGGEIFEVDGSNTPVGGFGNASTLSHPALTGPLTQPAFALRVQ